MILAGKHARLAYRSRAHGQAERNRRKAVHESRPNVVMTPLPVAPEPKWIRDGAVIVPQELRDGDPEPRKGVCPKCGRVFNGPNVPHFHLRLCPGVVE